MSRKYVILVFLCLVGVLLIDFYADRLSDDQRFSKTFHARPLDTIPKTKTNNHTSEIKVDEGEHLNPSERHVSEKPIVKEQDARLSKSSFVDEESQLNGYSLSESPNLVNRNHPTYRKMVNMPSLELKERWDISTTILSRRRRIFVKGATFPHLIIKEIVKKTAKNTAQVTSRRLVVADHLVVKFIETVDERQVTTFADKYQLPIRRKLLAEGYYNLEIKDVTLKKRDEIMQQLAQNELVEVVHDDSLVFSSVTPNDPMLNNQWHIINPNNNLDLKVRDMWDQNTDCSGLMVAVIDTGIDLDHPDLEANLAPAGLHRSFVNGETTGNDLNGHGTHVAGIVAAEGNNAVGVTGLCWRAQLVAIKVLGADGSGSETGVADGFIYATETNGIQIINASLGGPSDIAILRNAVAGIGNAGKILAVAAGNENNNIDVEPSYPAAYPGDHLLRVAAIDVNHNMANFSNYGQTVNIAAPGVNILATWNGGQCPTDGQDRLYCSISGTSMASPFVAGLLAQYWAQYPSATYDSVIKAVVELSEQVNFGGKAIKDDKRVAPLPAVKDAVTPSDNLANLLADVEFVNEGTQMQLSLEIERRENPIIKVEVFNGETLLGLSESSPYVFDLSIPSEGPLNLKVKITDSQNNVFEKTAKELMINKGPELSFKAEDNQVFYLGDEIEVSSKDEDGVARLTYTLADQSDSEEGVAGEMKTSIVLDQVGVQTISIESEDSHGAIKKIAPLEIEVRGYDELFEMVEEINDFSGSFKCELKIVFASGKEYLMQEFSLENADTCKAVCDMVAQYEIIGQKNVVCGAVSGDKIEYQLDESL